jgi:hypothetical protein
MHAEYAGALEASPRLPWRRLRAGYSSSASNAPAHRRLLLVNYSAPARRRAVLVQASLVLGVRIVGYLDSSSGSERGREERDLGADAAARRGFADDSTWGRGTKTTIIETIRRLLSPGVFSSPASSLSHPPPRPGAPSFGMEQLRTRDTGKGSRPPVSALSRFRLPTPVSIFRTPSTPGIVPPSTPSAHLAASRHRL